MKFIDNYLLNLNKHKNLTCCLLNPAFKSFPTSFFFYFLFCININGWGQQNVGKQPCEQLLQEFKNVRSIFISPNLRLREEFSKNNQKDKADSLLNLVKQTYVDFKTNKLQDCDITSYQYVTIFYTLYINFMYGASPGSRDSLFSEMSHMLTLTNASNRDSTFLELCRLKAIFHLRSNEFKKMKEHLEAGITLAERNPEIHYNALFALRCNYALYFNYMNLPFDALRISTKNDQNVNVYGVHNIRHFLDNLDNLIRAYNKLGDLKNMNTFIQKMGNFCEGITGTAEKNDCRFRYYSQQYFYFIKLDSFHFADSIFNKYLLNNISATDYDLKLYNIRLNLHYKKLQESEKEIEELQTAFNRYFLTNIHVYRLNLFKYQMELAILKNDPDLISKTLKETEFVFKSNIYNAFNEDPHLQLSILSPMQTMAWELTSKLVKFKNPNYDSTLFVINSSLKKLSPVFLNKRNVLFQSHELDVSVTNIKNKILTYSNELSTLNKNHTTSFEEKKILMDSIIQLNRKMHSVILKDLTFDIPDISIKNIRAKLIPGEVFIEFIEVFPEDVLKKSLFAYVIDQNHTGLIKLPSIDNINNDLKNYINNKTQNQLLYYKIFNDLEPFLKNKTIISIVSDGPIHQIPIEILSKDGSRKKCLLNQYSFNYYISSASFLNRSNTLKNKDNLSTNLIAVGGIQYDDCPSKPETTEKSELGALRSKNFLKYLPGSLKEVKIIDSMFKSRHLQNNKTIIGCDATKDIVLKEILDKKNHILHISTHGLLVKESDTLSTSSENYISFGNKSFLALAGGERGFVSAYEITNFNLAHLNLVYLSACSSGLGPKISGQGLFSIGDAFKNAGAKAVISTLWDIPDDFSVKFAELFYANYFSNGDADSALLIAKKIISQKYPPVYWASFRLLN